MLVFTNDDPDLQQTVINGEKSWEYRCDSETKIQLSEWTSPSPRPKKASKMSKVRIMWSFLNHENFVSHICTKRPDFQYTLPTVLYGMSVMSCMGIIQVVIARL